MRTTKVRKLFDTNYFGVVDTIKAVLPQMRARQSGHIVNISSMTGLVANPPNAYYSSTKFALEALTEALAQEVKPLGIKVTAIEPGAFRTDWAARSMWESSTPIGDYDENVGARKTMIKEFANHLPGDPRKVAEAVLMVTNLDEPPLRLLARPRRAEGGARQARRVLRVDRRVGGRHQGRQLPEGRRMTWAISTAESRSSPAPHAVWVGRTQSSSPAKVRTSSPSTSAQTFDTTDYPGATAEDLAETVRLVESQGPPDSCAPSRCP